MASTFPAKQVALVTGASSGMGKETAKRLLQEGLVVYVAARRLAQMQDLRALGAIPLQMDISVDAEIVAAVNTITQGHGGIDVGAQGKKNVIEKDIVFEFSRELKAHLERSGRYRVALTRNSDWRKAWRRPCSWRRAERW